MTAPVLKKWWQDDAAAAHERIVALRAYMKAYAAARADGVSDDALRHGRRLVDGGRDR